jgi:hypothetical protein
MKIKLTVDDGGAVGSVAAYVYASLVSCDVISEFEVEAGSVADAVPVKIIIKSNIKIVFIDFVLTPQIVLK